MNKPLLQQLEDTESDPDSGQFYLWVNNLCIGRNWCGELNLYLYTMRKCTVGRNDRHFNIDVRRQRMTMTISKEILIWIRAIFVSILASINLKQVYIISSDDLFFTPNYLFYFKNEISCCVSSEIFKGVSIRCAHAV